MINLSNVSLRRGSKVLFEHASFQIHPGQKVGITGANGCGKSSLFSMVLDKLHPDNGEYSHPDDWVIAHVAQTLPNTDQPALEYVLDGDDELRRIQSDLEQAEAAHNGEAIGHLHNQLDNIDGYTATARAASLLSGLGFEQLLHQQPVSTFSGGWQMRLNLARALMCRSDLLLLDEPTNHLDIDTIIWFEGWLKSYRGTLLLISHDRDFLNNTCTHIANIEHQTIKLYKGNYDAFETIRSEQLARQQAEYEKQQRTIKQIESFVSRFKAKATKAKQAQSRLKTLQRMQRISPAHIDSQYRFSFRIPEKLPASLLQLEAVNFAYNDRVIIQNISLQIVPGDRIALLGPNGAGKSTMIKLLAGQLNPISGLRHQNSNTTIGYFAQHQLDQLHDEHTPVEHIRQIDNRATESDIRDFLGSFGFSGDSAVNPIKGFSGGEKSRLALSLIVYRKPNLLLLDEPTNHLDLEMRQALAMALQAFEGAMVIVSHDRYLINACCDQLYIVHNGKVDEFDYSLDEYPDWLEQQSNIKTEAGTPAPDTLAESSRSSRKERKQIEAQHRERTSPLRKKLATLEKQMEDISEKLRQIDSDMADHSLYDEQNREKLITLTQIKSGLDKDHQSHEEEWLAISEQLEEMDRALK